MHDFLMFGLVFLLGGALGAFFTACWVDRKLPQDPWDAADKDFSEPDQHSNPPQE